MVNIFGIVIGVGLSVAILWAIQKFVLKQEKSILENVWMIALVLIVVGIAGFVGSKVKLPVVPQVKV